MEGARVGGADGVRVDGRGHMCVGSTDGTDGVHVDCGGRAHMGGPAVQMACTSLMEGAQVSGQDGTDLCSSTAQGIVLGRPRRRGCVPLNGLGSIHGAWGARIGNGRMTP